VATALAAVGAHAGGIRDGRGLRVHDLCDHWRPPCRHPRKSNNCRMGKAGDRRGHSATGRYRRLAGVPVVGQPDPHGRSGHSGGFAAIVGYIEDRLAHLLGIAVLVALVLMLTGCGVGAVLGWAVRMTLSHLSAVGTMAVRALPFVMLTVLMFFNTYAWIMAATISRRRLWLALLFLFTIAAAFVISVTLERVRPMLRSTATLPKDSERLADTPFAAMPDPPVRPPLTKPERLNVVFVVAASQLVQILIVAMVTATIFLILGLILLSPPLLAQWTNHGSSKGTLLGMTLPLPEALIQMSLFLAALTFMYLSARALGDSEYRSIVVDPLIDDLHANLIARNRYRSGIAAAADAAKSHTDRRTRPGIDAIDHGD
jgi:hypothetical protein